MGNSLDASFGNPVNNQSSEVLAQAIKEINQTRGLPSTQQGDVSLTNAGGGTALQRAGDYIKGLLGEPLKPVYGDKPLELPPMLPQRPFSNMSSDPVHDRVEQEVFNRLPEDQKKQLVKEMQEYEKEARADAMGARPFGYAPKQGPLLAAFTERVFAVTMQIRQEQDQAVDKVLGPKNKNSLL